MRWRSYTHIMHCSSMWFAEFFAAVTTNCRSEQNWFWKRALQLFVTSHRAGTDRERSNMFRMFPGRFQSVEMVDFSSIYACTRRVCSSAGRRNYGSGPDREKRPSASLANYWKEGQGRFQFAANVLQRRAEAARKGVAVYLSIANRVDTFRPTRTETRRESVKRACVYTRACYCDANSTEIYGNLSGYPSRK